MQFDQCEPWTTHSGCKSQDTVGTDLKIEMGREYKCSHLWRSFVTSWAQLVAPLWVESIDKDAKKKGKEKLGKRMAESTKSAFWQEKGWGNGGTWTDERQREHNKVEFMKAGEHYEEPEERQEKRVQVESNGEYDE